MTFKTLFLTAIFLWATALAAQEPASEAMGRGETVLDISGESLGGNVRAGPGITFADVGSLPERTPITILSNSGVSYNGYDWFTLRFGDRIVYQWGGIMCADGGTPGILVACENARALLHPTAPAEVQFPIEGQSWGGVVRAGPGMDHERNSSLAEGTPITVVRNTGVTMNGYDWFEITYPGGSGFQWGGIVCADTELPGSFSPCDPEAALQAHESDT